MSGDLHAVTNRELLVLLRSVLHELELRVANYREADEDPETEDLAADDGLVLSSRAARLLGDAAYELEKHVRHFEQLRPKEDDDDDAAV